MKKKLLLIDTMAVAFRSYYALMRSPLKNNSGLPTSSIFGTAMFLQRLTSDYDPDYICFVTDTKEPTFRKEMYEAYKANRSEMPEDLQEQIPHLYRLIEAYNLPLLKKPGYEADDIIGTIAKKWASSDIEVYIVSGDKDFFQLVDENIKCLITKKGNINILLDADGVKEKFGVYPKQVIDSLALIGDAADNIPGVSGIGPKGAKDLIEKYQTLDNIFDNIEEVRNNRQKNGLKNGKESAYLSKKLVTIDCNVEIDFQLEDASFKKSNIFNSKILELYKEFEFRQLTLKVENSLKSDGTEDPRKKVSKPNVTILDKNKVEKFSFENSNFTLYFECIYSTKNSNNATLKGVVFSIDGGIGYYLPIEESGNVNDFSIQFLRRLFDNSADKVTISLKNQVKLFKPIGLADCYKSFRDISILDYLLRPNSGKHDLSAIADSLLSEGLEPSDLWTKETTELSDEEFVELINLMGAKLQLIKKFNEDLKKNIKANELDSVSDSIEIPLAFVLAKMEKEGIFVDTTFLNNYSEKLNTLAKACEEEIYALSGEHFNIQSPKQLQQIIYEKLDIPKELGIKRIKKTKTGFSTDESVLTKLSEHPLPRYILEYRTIAKLKNTYVDTLPQHVNEKTGRLHTSFNQVMAATGRLSSEHPNLQNIPMRTKLGREIRKAFKSNKEGWKIISADYSQVEIRILAELSKEKVLIEAFKNNEDIHSLTAMKIFKVTSDEMTTELRSRAKAINFGIIYGMGPRRLSEETGVSLKEAKDFIERYFKAYPNIKKYTENIILEAISTGYTKTILGRKRPINGLDDDNAMIKSRAQNMAVNSPIQGSAADLIKMAMIQIDKTIEKEALKGKMLLQVHDELVFSSPKEEVDRFVSIIRHEMENAITTEIPMTVEIKVGDNWLEAHG